MKLCANALYILKLRICCVIVTTAAVAATTIVQNKYTFNFFDFLIHCIVINKIIFTIIAFSRFSQIKGKNFLIVNDDDDTKKNRRCRWATKNIGCARVWQFFIFMQYLSCNRFSHQNWCHCNKNDNCVERKFTSMHTVFSSHPFRFSINIYFIDITFEWIDDDLKFSLRYFLSQTSFSISRFVILRSGKWEKKSDKLNISKEESLIWYICLFVCLCASAFNQCHRYFYLRNMHATKKYWKFIRLDRQDFHSNK